MPINPEIVQDRLKAVRRSRGFVSPAQAAEADGFPVPKDTLIGWESRRVEPGALRLAEVCQFYDVSVAYVLGLVDDPTGLPVGQKIVDQRVIDRVEQAEDLAGLEDVMDRCIVCGDPSVIFGFSFPEGFTVKTLKEYEVLARRAIAKLERLKVDYER